MNQKCHPWAFSPGKLSLYLHKHYYKNGHSNYYFSESKLKTIQSVSSRQGQQ